MKKFLSIILVAVVVGGVCFFGGMKYAQSKVASNFPGGGNFNGQMPTGGTQNASSTRGSGGGGMVSGEVIAKDAQSLILKIQDGGSRIVFFSSSTTVSKIVEGSLRDIEIGKQIMVTGKQNSDGSYTAQTIQERQLPSLNPRNN